MDAEQDHKPKRTLLDRFLDIEEPKVTYLTKPTPIDKLLSLTVLKILPSSVTPNRITQFRFILIPFIAWALIINQIDVATVLFIIAACSDALDGARARMEHKITAWGTVYDPIADKLLISVVAIITVSRYISVKLAIVMVVIEMFLVASAYFRYKGKIVPAKTMGKTKMILQCLGIIFLLLSVILNVPILLTIATWTLYLSVLFAILSLFVFRSI